MYPRLASEKGSAQKEFFVMLGHLVFWPLVLMAYERLKMKNIGSTFFEAANNLFCRCTLLRRRGHIANGNVLTKEEAEDDDVRAEREVVDKEMLNPPANDPYAVRLVHMNKRYWARGKERTGTVAVKRFELADEARGVLCAPRRQWSWQIDDAKYALETGFPYFWYFLH